MSEIAFVCPQCEAPARVAFPREETGWTCSACGSEHPLHNAEALSRNEPVSSCAVCDCPRLYVQKDFNRAAGLWLVVVTALISGVVLLVTRSTLWAMAVLGVVTLFDALVYRMRPPVTVCYRCESVHRGFPPNDAHEAYDIHVAEEYAYGRE